MGYTTEFYGRIEIVPPLNKEEIEYLTKFSNTRRMKRKLGPYYVDGSGFKGQGNDPDIQGFNGPPDGQPSLWCQWIPTEDGKYIEWDGGEKFYEADQWMKYIIDHFIGSSPIAIDKLPFLQCHLCNGEIEAQGEERDDQWVLIVENNVVKVGKGEVTYGEAEEI